jgi:pyrroline-5-carboxylate reductase
MTIDKDQNMDTETLGFVGGGRITRIILKALARNRDFPQQVVVSDIDTGVLNGLKEQFPTINISSNNREAAAQNIVFLAVHPPTLNNILDEVQSGIKADTIIVSLLPKITMAKLSQRLGTQKIVRMIPNAPSIVGAGYNPLTISEGLTSQDKEVLFTIFNHLGQCPNVAEDKLEAYAVLTAMGPTYLWFQLYELQKLGLSFGLTEQEVTTGISQMALGMIKTMDQAELSPAAVMDLIPVKPLGDEEENIKQMYNTKLRGLYQKLTT